MFNMYNKIHFKVQYRKTIIKCLTSHFRNLTDVLNNYLLQTLGYYIMRINYNKLYTNYTLIMLLWLKRELVKLYFLFLFFNIHCLIFILILILFPFQLHLMIEKLQSHHKYLRHVICTFL